FRDDLRTTIQRKQDLERRLESLATPQQPAKPESFIEFCTRMERAWGITDRSQQRDFLRACLEEIKITSEEVNIRFSLNVAAAMAAIGPEVDCDSGTNCQLSVAAVGRGLFLGSHGIGESLRFRASTRAAACRVVGTVSDWGWAANIFGGMVI